MPFRPLGASGHSVSAFGLGGWNTFGTKLRTVREVGAVIRAALDSGINLFDTADSYAGGECERLMGQALHGTDRSKWVLCTKVFFPLNPGSTESGLSKQHILASIDASLQRLNVDYVDVYFCHRPDPNTPLAETIQTMHDLVRVGKIRCWGTSEWSPRRIRAAWGIAKQLGLEGPKVEQPQYSLLTRGNFERRIAPCLRYHGMAAMVWSPLASGVLTGKYDNDLPLGSRLEQIGWLREEILSARSLEQVRRMKTTATATGCSRAELALAYLLACSSVSSVLLGASSVDQLQSNLGALRVDMTEDLKAQLRALFKVPVTETIKVFLRSIFRREQIV